MTFLAPLYLALGALAAAAVVALHFLARQRPRPAALPTARFVPDMPVRWPSRSSRPTDWLLLALRVLAVLLVAMAFAHPVLQPDRAVSRRIVLVDRSRHVADITEVRDSLRSVMRDGDVAVLFDTTARVVATAAAATDSLALSAAEASLSAALVVARQTAVDLRAEADSLELVIISPFASLAWDDATMIMRRAWNGRARIVAVARATGDTAARRVDLRASRTDPVRAALRTMIASTTEPNVRLVRAEATAADSAWGRVAHRVLVVWPEDSASVTGQAVVRDDVVLAAPLVRRSLPGDSGTVLARWADGAPAVVEAPLGDGCVRTVGFDFPRRGDVPLRESAHRIVRALVAPCVAAQAAPSVADARLDSLRGRGRLLSTTDVQRAGTPDRRMVPWLLVLAMLALVAEWMLRNREQRS